MGITIMHAHDPYERYAVEVDSRTEGVYIIHDTQRDIVVGTADYGNAVKSAQTLNALNVANTTRLARVALKTMVAHSGYLEGAARISNLLEDPPAELLTVRLFDMLQWMHRVGPTQARRAMKSVRALDPAQSALTEFLTVGKMTPRQRLLVIQYLRGERVAA